MDGPRLSIVIPAYNEAARLPVTLARIGEYFATNDSPPEVLVIDDGSLDGTGDVALSFAKQALDVRVLHEPANRGKGYAVRRGMLAAHGELRLMCDADLSTPIEELPKLAAWIERGYDVAIGSRDLPDSRLDPPQPLLRRIGAWKFRAIRRRILLPGIRDTQCGFKLFTKRAAEDIFSRASVDGWLFDCEVLGLAERLGYRIREVGVTWENHPDSRVHVVATAWRTLPELLRIRRRLREVGPTPRRPDVESGTS